MKILFTLTPTFNPNAGGVQRSTFKIGKYLFEKRFTVAYFSMENKGHIKSDFGQLYFSSEPGGTENKNNLDELKKVLQTFKPDFVINQMPYENNLRKVLFENKNSNYILLGCLRNSLFNFKSFARDRMEQLMPTSLFKFMDNPIGIGIAQKRHYYKHRKDLKAIIDQHDKFILLAPPNKDELEHFVGNYKDEKILSIPNSIPKVEYNLGKKEKIILHVGRLNIAQKRSDLLMKIWEKVHPHLPDWEFVIVGDGPYMPELKTEIKDKNIPRVRLEGIQKPEPYYQKASIFMMPSAYEGFPNTIIEAQSYGCVPFAFDSYLALSWIVNHENDAVLSPAFDVEDMANMLTDVALNKSKMDKMQIQSLENAEKFTIEKVGEIWINLFNNLAKDI